MKSRSQPESQPRVWRSLDELEDTPEFRARSAREFLQDDPSRPDEGLDRRRFLELSAASVALASAAACTRQPPEQIVAYVRQPEEVIPGRPLYFATSMSLGGIATGLLVESHMGRPTKVEGHPDHPASLGATDAFAQAAVLDLYDPRRSRPPSRDGEPSDWDSFVTELQEALTAQEAAQGRGVRLLTGSLTSPSLVAQIEDLLERFPEAGWHQWEAAGRDGADLGGRVAFGDWTDTHYDLEQADVVLALDADFLVSGPGCLRYAHDFVARRRRGLDNPPTNRLYVAESTPSGTGSLADHRLALSPSEIASFALALAFELGLDGVRDLGGADRRWRPWVEPVAADLRRRPGRSLVIAGETSPPELHVLAHAINHVLGNVGKTVFHTDPVAAHPVDRHESLAGLVDDLEAGRVEVLLVFGGNPAHDAPADLGFAEAAGKAAWSARLGLYADETSSVCLWDLPEAHFLEAWGDGRAWDGTLTFAQPLIEPLWDGWTMRQVVTATGGRQRSDESMLRRYWRGQDLGEDFLLAWRQAIHDGFLADTALPPREVELDPAGLAQAIAGLEAMASHNGELELAFRPDPSLWDGRFAGNGWLQELPKPFSHLTWDNALLVAPATAAAHGLASEDVVRLGVEGRTIEIPVLVQPGQAEGALTLHLGHGRKAAGPIGTGVGVDAYALRTSQAPWHAQDVEMVRTGHRHRLATTQMHRDIALETTEAERRHLVRTGTIEEYRRDPDLPARGEEEGERYSFNPRWEYPGYSWGLSVDLSACTGCNSCVVACQSENNIPIVGKDQVLLGREMQWLRIDRYYEGDLDAPQLHHQPVMCMHCEEAPCELVCPVAATVHSSEGLNDMVYNRCIGTRYCSNNCPYKVRHFNFLQYTDLETPARKAQRNPDVTVRTVGVIEKCTYCVQRINAARLTAKREDRPIADGEIQTACQQACPTQAIVFGNLNDAQAEVSRRKASPLDYGILTDLGTEPRTTYLAKLRNPNPILEPPGGTES